MVKKFLQEVDPLVRKIVYWDDLKLQTTTAERIVESFFYKSYYKT